MKKSSVLWLLTLAAALFIGFPSALSAGGKKDKVESPPAPELAQPQSNLGNEIAPPPIPSETFDPLPVKDPVAASPIPVVEDEVVSAQRLGATPTFVKPGERDLALPGDTPVPTWVLDPDPEEQQTMVIGIGSAHSSTDQLSIQMAEARARQDIAFQLNVQIQAKISDYAENEGNKGGSEFNFSEDSVTERIGQQLTNIELKGVRVAKREKAQNGTWWVKVLWSKDLADKATTAVSQVVINEVGPGERAREAARLLDEQLEKASLKPSVVSE